VRIALKGSGMTCIVFRGGQTTTTTIYAGDHLCGGTTAGDVYLRTTTDTLVVNEFLTQLGISIERSTGGSAEGELAVII
jgi:hypothetical protein